VKKKKHKLTNKQTNINKTNQQTYNRSAFGGIWGFNTKFEKATADFIINKEKIFVEVLLAPEFDEEALAILKTKKDIRVISFGDLMSKRNQIYETPEIRSVLGGSLLQDYDYKPIVKEWIVKTKR